MPSTISARFRLPLVFGTAAVLLLWGYACFAQAAVPLPVEVLLRLRSFEAYDPFAISADGRWTAFVVNEKSAKASTIGRVQTNDSVLRVLDLETQAEKELALPDSSPSMPDWSPDGRYLAFCSRKLMPDAPPVRTVSVWDRLLGKHWELVRVEECIIGTFRWAQDSRHIYIRTGPRQATRETAERSVVQTFADPDERSRAPEGVSVRLYTAEKEDSDQSRQADPWDISASYDLVDVDVLQGHSERLLADVRIGAFWVSPDGEHVAVAVRKRFAQPGTQQLLYDLAVLDVSRRSFRVLATDVKLGPTPFTVTWSPDGKFLACRSAGMLSASELLIIDVDASRRVTFQLPSEGHALKAGFAGSVVQLPLWDETGHSVLVASKETIWKASVADGRLRALARFPGKVVETIRKGSNLTWSTERGSAIVLIARDEKTQKRSFHKVNLNSGEHVELFAGEFDVDSPINMFAPERGGSVFYVAESSARSRDLWAFAAHDREPHSVTHLNPELNRYPMGSSRIIEWMGMDGQRLRGALLLPSDFQSGKRYPLIVGVYGGHFLSANLPTFGFSGCISPMNMQLFATRGYAVLCPDAPQSVGTPLFDLAKTVLPGVNKVIELGIADPDRVGIMGHSYGGYSVLCLLVQTKRFKAAVVSSGYSDLFSHYAAMDKLGNSFGVAADEGGQGLMDGTPWAFYRRYAENSPFLYLNRVETPLLILHGLNDDTVPSFLADQIFVGLRRLGKRVFYAQYAGAGHSAEAWGYENHKDYLTRILDWFVKAVPPNS
ncbi:MAG TPA: prolyl oligopeptidase family serine peptidase [Terriglobales bacterium]|nr:prolyl oligopeptidase family serine peptidase [Terriglobales bacterium]